MIQLNVVILWLNLFFWYFYNIKKKNVFSAQITRHLYIYFIFINLFLNIIYNLMTPIY